MTVSLSTASGLEMVSQPCQGALFPALARSLLGTVPLPGFEGGR